MRNKPAQASGYSSSAVQLVRAASLYLATRLGDLADDLVIVGGLVPTLIVPQSDLPAGGSPHVGTMDVDLGLALALLDEQRYHELCERLRQAGFGPDTNQSGRVTSQRWQIESEGRNVTVDFLIPVTSAEDKGGTLRNLEADFAAIITPGLELAFQDRRRVTLQGETLQHEQASRDVWVCDAGAFTVLKALAFAGRGENKDAYDLVYVLQNYGRGVEDIVQHLRPLLASPFTQQALTILKNDFAATESVGTMRFAEFLGSGDNENLLADAAGAVRALLTMCEEAS